MNEQLKLPIEQYVIGARYRLCIQQHGETAGFYSSEAIFVRDACLIQNFGLGANMKSYLNIITSNRDRRRLGIVDIKFFAKPKSYCLGKKLIHTLDIPELITFIKDLYPRDMSYFEPGGLCCWDESEIYHCIRELNQDELTTWLWEKLSVGYWIEEWVTEQCLSFELFLEGIAPRLFRSKDMKVSLYRFVDDLNANTDFAPYIVMGDTCLLVLAERWEL